MIEDIKQKNRWNGTSICIKRYFDTQKKDKSFIDFIQDEYETTTTVYFEKAGKKSADGRKTYMQLVVEALDEIEKAAEEGKKIYLNALGQRLLIPRNTDKFEIQEIVCSFLIKNGSFYSEENEHDQYSYESSDFVGPFIDYDKEESENEVVVRFGRSYPEDAKYADKTYMQLVVEALEAIDKKVAKGKRISLNAWGNYLTIPRNSDRYEIQELLSTFIVNNGTFESKKTEGLTQFDGDER